MLTAAPPALRGVVALVATLAALAATGCDRPAPADERPSFLLFVMDTTRADAVSAYGAASGTTPNFDALARDGLLYHRAYAQAPWTLPSHASLFTGLLPSRHGVGWQRTQAPDDWVTLAGSLHDAGYETVGVSENIWVGEAFHMTAGFERFAGFDVKRMAEPDVIGEVKRWIAGRDASRPFFLFVNVIDAHAPYAVREHNPDLPPDVTLDEARSVPQDPALYFCSTSPGARAQRILHGLYLGGVTAADAKLGQVLGALRAAGLTRNLVSFVTADHGEQFGTHGLVSHQFSVREEVLHVPLVVQGVPGAVPAAIDTPVRLVDVMPTMLEIAGRPVPQGLAGRALPTRPGTTGGFVVSELYDIDPALSARESPLAAMLRKLTDAMRHACHPEDRVFGNMRALIDYPWKLVWFERYPEQLFDLERDPHEAHDLSAERPEVVARLDAALREATAMPAGAMPSAAPGREAMPQARVLEGLRALGYVGDAEPSPSPAPR